MTSRLVPALALAFVLPVLGRAADTQPLSFSTSTTGPVPKAGTAPKQPAGTPQPIEVLSEGQGTFSLKEEYAFYRVNVRVNDPQFFLRCDSLRLNLDLKGSKGTNQPVAKPLVAPPDSSTNKPVTVGPMIGPMGGKVRDAEALGQVVFSNKVDFSQAFADRVIYRATNDAFELTGNARVIKGTLTNTADTILFLRGEGRFDFKGNFRTYGTYTPAKTNSPPTTPAPAPKQP
ncbi:MAG: hypothetical protein EBS84_16750 [Proteobacteria bacterium]|nr:hypothetical protein [Verrucomicrobiota bacterium]NBU10642.1 hypothetical protein [Pseudomonadota bacterium]